MTDYRKVRQVIEFEIEIDEDYEWKSLDPIDPMDYTDSLKVIHTELLEERHEVDYVFGCDYEREVHQLFADGKLIFEHRNHDEVCHEYGRQAGVKITLHPLGEGSGMWGQGGNFMSYGDPDASWDIIRPKTKTV